ncbi:MAG: hypothetical protein FWF50_02075 [Defluviitaleaceae bacterium]|nr:hypothetical protein [Defluviitaleaceae bacterium]
MTVDEFLSKRIEENFKKLGSYIDDNKEEIVKSLAEKLNELVFICKKQQMDNEKNEISYLHIAFLKSSILTKTYEFRLALYDKNFWLDKTETEAYFKFDFLFDYIEKDIENASEYVEKGPNLKFRLEEVKNEYTYYYMQFLKIVLSKTLIEALKESYMDKLSLNEDFKVLFGGYMENAETILSK